MKAYSISKYSKTAKLELVTLAEPNISANEVLVEVHASSINQLDAKIKGGEFKLILPYQLPLILGHDVAGIVKKVGTKVKRFKVGDQVYSRPSDFKIGTFAEFIAIHEDDVALKPKNLTMEEAASIPLVALTAWQAFVEIAHLKKGQKVFIQAGSGGVGTIAIQLAKHLGATVATTTSEKNFELVRNLGADMIVDYKTQHFEDVLKDYDLVLNSQDRKSLERSLNVTKIGGMVVSISGPPTPTFASEAKLPWYLKLAITALSSKIRRKAKKLGINYSFLFMKPSGLQLNELTKLIEADVISPIIDKTFSIEQINEAVNYVESGRAKGKVVIKVKSSEV